MISEKQPEQPLLRITTSRQFISWLADMQVSLALTTYQTGKIIFIGLQPNGKLSVFERTLERVMGMTATRETIWLATLYQVWRFRNVMTPGQMHEGYDAVYIPRESRVTGDVDVHDMAIDADGRPVFVNTLFNCIATIDEQHSFRPLWKPGWVSKLAPEDRCHLNGMAMLDGKPRFVTAVSRSDVQDGWRDRRQSSGVLVDVESGEGIVEGLSMPHSPRWHNGKLWLINSGTGFLGTVDLDVGRFEPVAFCPGFARGLAILGDWAVIGLSHKRENRTFQGLDLEQNLSRHDAEARCGLMVVDLRTGDAPHWLRFEGVVRELYDVDMIPGVTRPMAIGFKTEEIRRYISMP
mgnify:CR=1 FL=1